jgi:hypothetical protein
MPLYAANNPPKEIINGIAMYFTGIFVLIIINNPSVNIVVGQGTKPTGKNFG